MLQSIVFHTLGQLATGILLFIAFVPPSRIGPGFGRFHTMLALVLWCCGLWGEFPPEFFLLAALLLASAASAGKDVIYYPFLILSFACSIYLLAMPDLPEAGLAQSVFSQLPAILVLGGSSVAMLLGHWYLVAPKLPMGFLKAVTVALIIALLLRTGLIIGLLLRNGDQLASLHFYEIYGIFFVQRIALGLVLTLILSVLTYLCVRIRSTQSATGILYVVVVFCLAGELIGAYLFAKTGMLF